MRSDLPSVLTGERTLFAWAVTSPRARLVTGMSVMNENESKAETRLMKLKREQKKDLRAEIFEVEIFVLFE